MNTYSLPFHTFYIPENQNIKATILVLHGMQEHSGRYDEFAKFLSNSGYAVLTYDHLGHGKTAKNKESLGYFQKENPKQKVIDDAENMAKLLESRFPNIPHFVLGHSMGSFITRCLLQQAGEKFSGAIIVGTGGGMKGLSIGKFFAS